jgi:hypothetical protein
VWRVVSGCNIRVPIFVNSYEQTAFAPANLLTLAHAQAAIGSNTTNQKETRYTLFLAGMTKRFYDAGISIVAGTDGFAGFALHRELEP